MNPNQTILQGVHQSTSDKTPAPLAGPANAITFALDRTPPPSIVYIGRDDQLFLICMSSQANEIVTANIRLLLPNGVIVPTQVKVPLPTAYTQVTQLIPLAEGYLLTAGMAASLASVRGQTFARLAIVRAGSQLQTVYEVLCADYINSSAPLGFPFGRVIDPLEGPGNLRRISVTTPGAGADWSQAVPTGARWRLAHLRALLTTAVAAGARNPHLQGVDGAVIFESIPSPADQAASLAVEYTISDAFLAGSAAAASNVWSVDQPFMLDAGWTLRVLTANIQGADQWTAVVIVVEEWLRGT